MRWLLLTLALGIALTALYSLLSDPVRVESDLRRGSVAAGGTPQADSEGARHAPGEIREPSRRKLREILREDEDARGDRR